MNIAFLVNKIETEKPNYTTVHLAHKAMLKGHTSFMLDAENLSYGQDGEVCGYGKSVTGTKYRSVEKFLEALQVADRERIDMRDMDILFLRTDPSEEKADRLWAQSPPYMFGQHAIGNGTIVLNHPASLSGAINKLYFQHFPRELRPDAIITRNPEEIMNFYKEHKCRMILKPLQGSGGENVFMAEKKTENNLNQIIEAISRDGYIIAQEYLPDGKNGDVRMLMMNGEILMSGKKAAIMRRINKGSDIRSNITAGGKSAKAKLTPEMIRIAELLRPKLIQDGMFFVGVDIIGDKLLEVNVFSPGGLPFINKLYDASFDDLVLESLEQKVIYKKDYQGQLTNLSLNCL